eukprot:TRINITY_DN34603_c0_g1_i1.p1 TRINITY_DN34603_c0_g1~~TRINITY_DN34603_c0_g1_i1.p1  ORF type:complete len:335 (+),score=56.55 TRINITY_DN34603_c0_g1_i1:66-1007(+)
MYRAVTRRAFGVLKRVSPSGRQCNNNVQRVDSRPWRGNATRWCSSGARDDFFDAVDSKTFTKFLSMQTVLEKDGKKVTLIPMQHIASEAFFNSVLEEVKKDEHYLILMEGVMDNDELRQHEKNTCMRVAVDPSARQHLSSQIENNSHFAQQEEEDLFEATYVPYTEAKQLGLVHQELYFKPRVVLSSPLKVHNSDVNRDKVMAIEDKDERDFFIVHGRTDHCGRVLRGLLEEDVSMYSDNPAAESIAVCWGHIHCEHLIDDLISRNWTVTRFGPSRNYGWSEELYNEVAVTWKATDHSFDTVMAQLKDEKPKE